MAVSAHHNLGTVRAKKMIGKCPAWEGTLRNFNLACLTLCFYVHFFSLSMTGKKKRKNLQSEFQKRAVCWVQRTEMCQGLLLHFTCCCLCAERARKRERGNETTQLPENQDVANNICSPFQRQGAYTYIGYSL